MTEVLAPRADVLGVRVSAITISDAMSVIERWIAERSRNYVCVTGAHGVISSRTDAELRDIHNRAGLVTPDGMPVVWMSRALGFKRTERVLWARPDGGAQRDLGKKGVSSVLLWRSSWRSRSPRFEALRKAPEFAGRRNLHAAFQKADAGRG